MTDPRSNGGSRSVRGAPVNGGRPATEFYMDQDALDNPPPSPSNFLFITHAIVQVGRAKIPEWNDAERSAAVTFGRENSAADLVKSASRLLQQAVLDNKIRLYSRPSSGGLPQAMPANASADDYLWQSMARGSVGPAAYKTAYIFVDRAELDRAFPSGGSQDAMVGTIPLESLSPYLRLMIEVSQMESLTEASRISPESLGAKLTAEAGRFGLTVGAGNDGSDITKTWAEQLAKALRWPVARRGSSEAGRTRKA